jgi:glycosyltransferase involved in cell wall biosynthesis
VKNNLVSIITPSYNSSRFISQTIESVLNQTYENWEMIIVDDVSPDNSNAIIEEYIKKDSRIKLIKLEKNSGPAVARNRAIEKATGRYIAFLDADDLWMPQKLDKQIKFMQEKQCALSYTSYDLIDEKNVELGTFIVPHLVSYADLLKTNSIGCLTAMYDVEILGKTYFPNIIKKQDFALWLRILQKVNIAEAIIEPLATYRIRKVSVSSNKIKNTIFIWKIFRQYTDLNILQSIYYFIYYALNGLKKYR